jgi:hypothetical protein
MLGLAAALAAGGQAAAGPPKPEPPPEPGTLAGKLFGPKPPKRAGPTERTGPVTVTAPLKPEVLADAWKAERDAQLRRLSVCTELRRVAFERGDEALARQADELERQVTALYNARVAGLGIARPKTPPAEPASFLTAEPLPVPDNLAAKAAALTAPAAPIPGTTAEVREVNP